MFKNEKPGLITSLKLIVVQPALAFELFLPCYLFEIIYEMVSIICKYLLLCFTIPSIQCHKLKSRIKEISKYSNI